MKNGKFIILINYCIRVGMVVFFLFHNYIDTSLSYFVKSYKIYFEKKQKNENHF